MDYHGLSWIIMDYHGLSWTIMDYHGLSWTTKDYQGLPWNNPNLLPQSSNKHQQCRFTNQIYSHIVQIKDAFQKKIAEKETLIHSHLPPFPQA